jgi:hypothetical protein
MSGAPHPSEPAPVKALDTVAEGRRRAGSGRRQRQRWHAVADERGLLVKAERKREVDQLRRGGRMLRLGSGLLENSERGGADEPGSG